MKIVVTGAGGRLARTVIPHLLTNPSIDRIIGIDRLPASLEHPRYRSVILDVRSPAVARYLKGADAMLHMAFVLMGGGLGRRRHDRALVRDINVNGSINVFEAAARLGVRRQIFLSSAAAYGAWPDNPPLITETQPLRAIPGFAYSEDKVAVETWLDGFEQREQAVEVLRLRPHVILGPNAHPLLRRMLRQPFYPALGTPAPLTQCIWESDVASAIEAALFRGEPGPYNLAAQPATSFRDMLAQTQRLLIPVPVGLAEALHHLAWHLTPLAGDPGWVQAMRYSLAVDTARARQQLGWSPNYDVPGCLRALCGEQ